MPIATFEYSFNVLHMIQRIIVYVAIESNYLRIMNHSSKVDRIDFAILSKLMSNARASNKEIAAAVGLAPSSCHQRIRALRTRGILRGTHAEVDLPSLGWPLEALLFV